MRPRLPNHAPLTPARPPHYLPVPPSLVGPSPFAGPACSGGLAFHSSFRLPRRPRFPQPSLLIPYQPRLPQAVQPPPVRPRLPSRTHSDRAPPTGWDGVPVPPVGSRPPPPPTSCRAPPPDPATEYSSWGSSLMRLAPSQTCHFGCLLLRSS